MNDFNKQTNLHARVPDTGITCNEKLRPDLLRKISANFINNVAGILWVRKTKVPNQLKTFTFESFISFLICLIIFLKNEIGDKKCFKPE